MADREFKKTQENNLSPDTLLESGGANQNQNKNQQEEDMSDFKIVYLIVERGAESNRQAFWRSAGVAFKCRDGSINVKLDIHPGLTFNIRDPKSIGERDEVAQFVDPVPVQGVNDDIPF